MKMRRDVFQAIADPTRRRIIGIIVEKPMSVNSIAEEFNVTRQAVSLHLKILVECGLAVVKKNGRERYCEAKLDNLSEVSEWIEQYKKHWETQFDKMEIYINELKKQNAKSKE